MTDLFEFFDTNFDDEERRCARTYGCAATGIPGLICYCETADIYDCFKDEIWHLINESGGLHALIDPDDFCCPAHFENAMVWRAFEIYALLHTHDHNQSTHH